MKSKLVLFDIDGTLSNRVGNLKESLWRFPYAVEKLFGIKLSLTVDDYMSFNGWVDKAQIWEMVKTRAITREEYLRKFPKYGEYALEYMNLHKPVYRASDGAKELLEKLSSDKNFALGIITGNVEQLARWKLDHTGLKKFFQFGLFGGEADNRIELAKLVFAKAKTFFKQDFSSTQITIIGDTVHDVRCAKAIGAKVILVLTGGQNSEVPKDEIPDLVVDSLVDKRVYDFLDLGNFVR